MIGKAQQLRRQEARKTFIAKGEFTDMGQYTKLVSDYEKGEALLTIGPNYLFFLITFLLANTVSLFTIARLNGDERAKPFLYLSIVILIFLDVVWLATALINPGIGMGTQQQGNLCQDCLDMGREVSQTQGTVHCTTCQVCIEEQVMHFKLIGGCIGKNNFIAFKLLLLGIFLWCLSLLTILPQTFNHS